MNLPDLKTSYAHNLFTRCQAYGIIRAHAIEIHYKINEKIFSKLF